MYQGTKGTLILLHESEALLFDEEASKRSTAISVAPRDGGAAAVSSETMAGNRNTSVASAGTATQTSGARPVRIEIQRFCSAIRTRIPVACGPDKAILSARPCILANESIKRKERLKV
jgi:hypothetical protein